jgi:two-component system sensor histidine kinase MprB
MVAGKLEARLSGRLLLIGGTVLVAVAFASVAVTDRVLDAEDTASARGKAMAALDSLQRELDEGDSPREAAEEVVASAKAQGVRLVVRRPIASPPGELDLWTNLGDGPCATYADERSAPWRVCAAETARAAVVAAIPIGAHRDATRSLARGMVAVVLVAMLAVWLAVRRTVRASLRDLSAIVRWTAQIVEAGEMIEPPAAETLEVARLEAAFDALLRRLLDALARERANSEHMAHELRTPLTSIVAELESLRVPDEASRAALARVRADVVRLAEVIDAILVLSDSPRRRQREPAVINISDVARDVVSSDVKVQAPEEALVRGDEQLVSLALKNLLDNARKYGAGVELVKVTREGDAVRLAVIDRGAGLDESARTKMFDRYWRGSADGEGRGLGLALVRAVAERHGGGVDARSAPDGKALEVSLTLGGIVAWHEGVGLSR